MSALRLRSLLSIRTLLIALAGSALLTYLEWIEHHPPNMVMIAILHFVFVWAAIALVVYGWQRYGPATRRRE